MAAWTDATEIQDTNAGDAAVQTSGAFTPAAGDLIVVTIRSAGTAIAPVVTTSDGLEFVELDRSTASTLLFGSTTPAAAVSQTLSLDFTGDNVTAVLAKILRLAGMSRFGLAALRQAADASAGGGTTPAITLAADTLDTDPILAFLGGAANPPNVTEPTGFTEHPELGVGTPNTGLEAATLDSGNTAATITWGAVSASAWRGIVAEFDARAIGRLVDGGRTSAGRVGGRLAA